MSKKSTDPKIHESPERCSGYMARGALVWGPLYTTGVSGMAYAVAPSLAGEALPYTDLFMHSLYICPTFGAAGGYLRWRFTGSGADGREPGGKAARRYHFPHFGSGRKKGAHKRAA